MNFPIAFKTFIQSLFYISQNKHKNYINVMMENNVPCDMSRATKLNIKLKKSVNYFWVKQKQFVRNINAQHS